MNAKLVLEDNTLVVGRAFGHQESRAGEVVFNTGMVGYPESLTDPSYRGQILVLTYPLIGNYGVPADAQSGGIHTLFESDRIQVAALIVSEYAEHFSHWNGKRSIDQWLTKNQVPGLSGVDTRMLTHRLRKQGTMLGKIVYEERDINFYDPNTENLVAQVSVRQPLRLGRGAKKVLIIDCGCKHNIIRSLLRRGLELLVVPWNWPIANEAADGVVISNGPGDPKQCQETIESIRTLIQKGIPTLGICLGNQLLALAAGADTYKMKFGHRSQNQPCVLVGSKRCFITSQNHGYAVDQEKLPTDWLPWFFNANDGTNEGIRHRSKPLMGVQFHPEAAPGPVDTQFIFDEFIQYL